jgi:hypothetical protein
MNRIIATVSILAILTVLQCLFVQQHANAVVIRAIVKTWDKSPSYISGQTLLNMRNPIVSDMSFPTTYIDTFGNIPTITVDPNNILLNGVLTSFTSREDTNRTSFIISLPITQTKNNAYITSIKAEGSGIGAYGGAFNRVLPVTDYAARLDFSRYSGAGVFQIGPKELIDDNLFSKTFRIR